MDYYKIGQRIRKIRKAHGMSQEELAERVAVVVLPVAVVAGLVLLVSY